MSTTIDAASDVSFCRAVTPEEVAHYKDKGWVQLKRFIAPEMIAAMLAKAKELMGEDGDSNPPYGIDQPYFNAFAASGYNDPNVRPLFGGIGQAAKALMDRKADYGVRLFSDFFAPKLPAAKKTRNAGNGPTSFHQDYITFAVEEGEVYKFGSVSIENTLQEVRAEARKISWPSRKETWITSVMVLIMVLLAATFFWIVDWLLGVAFQFIIALGS